MVIATPYYLVDEQRMLPAMEKIQYVHKQSGAKSVLALKCFSTWCAFEFMSEYLAGTTSSSLYEARLGQEKFGRENHGYAVAYSDAEIREVVTLCDKMIFNSLSQFERFKKNCKGLSVGLRLNPEIGFSPHKLSNTVCEYSRLGVTAEKLSDEIIGSLDGVMFHVNCDNDDYSSFADQISVIEERFGPVLEKMKWVSLGGGVAFTDDSYPLDDFVNRLSVFAETYQIQVYLEPGEAAVTGSTSLVVSILDIVDNGLPTLIVDAGVETHLLDVLIYDYTPALDGAIPLEDDEIEDALRSGEVVYRVSGRTCLSGDVFGHYVFDQEKCIGDRMTFTDAGGYSMVKKNFFNGISMPSICHRKINGDVSVVREFNYDDFKQALS